jgi:hypothetical protein
MKQKALPQEAMFRNIIFMKYYKKMQYKFLPYLTSKWSKRGWKYFFDRYCNLLETIQNTFALE